MFFCRSLYILIALSMCFSLVGCAVVDAPQGETISIAIPYENRLADVENSYYFIWLEEQSGLDIELSFLPSAFTSDYLELIFTDEYADIDAVFFTESSAPSVREVTEYGEEGLLHPLDTLISQESVELKQLFDSYEIYDLEQTLYSGQNDIYYMPQIGKNLPKSYEQTMWINSRWLSETGHTIPTSTDEFADVLTSFKSHYPDGVPMIGSPTQSGTFSLAFLMNSFAVFHRDAGYFATMWDRVFYPPMTDGWREGLIYLSELYELGLIADENFSYNTEQLISICNDASMPVGVFTANELSDILSVNSPDLLSYYLAVPPLSNKNDVGRAIKDITLPIPGGVILSSSEKKDEAFLLMDIMCSEQAYLIGNFGRPSVDWSEAEVGDISVSGTPALITVIGNGSTVRDVNGSGVFGPFITRDNYAEAVAWKGYQINQSEYVEARASRTYEDYETQNALSPAVYNEARQDKSDEFEQLIFFTEEMTRKFIVGEQNVTDDNDWQMYLDRLKEYDVDMLIDEMQLIYEKTGG